MDFLIEKGIELGMKFLLALIVLIVGFRIIHYFEKLILKKISLFKTDATFESFLRSFFKISMKLVIIIIAMATAGVEMTVFVALLGASGIAIGLALQGSLSNLAAGVLIVSLRPFKIGDFIESASYMGTVNEIGLFYTRLSTPDNRAVILPNSEISSASIINYSFYESRRLDLEFGVDYNSDISQVKALILKTLEKHPHTLDTPEPFVRLAEHADSALKFKVRVWVNSVDYWNTFFDLQEQIKEAFDENQIEIPYPHLVIQKK